MDEKVKVLMEHMYRAPDQTANDVKLHELAAKLRNGLSEEQTVILDALMAAGMDCMKETAENAFEQGANAGAMVILCESGSQHKLSE